MLVDPPEMTTLVNDAKEKAGIKRKFTVKTSILRKYPQLLAFLAVASVIIILFVVGLSIAIAVRSTQSSSSSSSASTINYYGGLINTGSTTAYNVYYGNWNNGGSYR